MSRTPFGLRIHHVAHLLLQTSDRILQEQVGIGMSQFRILQIVQATPNVMQQQVAKTLDQSEASISRQVKLLEAERLLSLHSKRSDRRQHVIAVTPKGRRVIEVAHNVLEAFYAQCTNSLTKAQQNELDSLLNEIEQRVKVVSRFL